jgi:hypothetical protein
MVKLDVVLSHYGNVPRDSSADVLSVTILGEIVVIGIDYGWVHGSEEKMAPVLQPPDYG